MVVVFERSVSCSALVIPAAARWTLKSPPPPCGTVSSANRGSVRSGLDDADSGTGASAAKRPTFSPTFCPSSVVRLRRPNRSARWRGRPARVHWNRHHPHRRPGLCSSWSPMVSVQRGKRDSSEKENYLVCIFLRCFVTYKKRKKKNS